MHQEVAVAVIVVLVVATIGAVILIGSESLGGQSQSATQSATTSNNNSLQLTSTSSQQSVASSSSTSTASGPYCLLSVPADAQIGYSVNSTFYGHVVTYSNGTQAFFSEFSCPQPVFGEKSSLIPLVYYNATTSVYAMAVAAESNSSFVAAENGSEFLFFGTSALGCSGAICGLDLYFYNYGETTYRPCGDPTGFAREPLTGIRVTFMTNGTYNQNGVWISYGWVLQDPVFHSMSANDVQLNTFTGSCGP